MILEIHREGLSVDQVEILFRILDVSYDESVLLEEYLIGDNWSFNKIDQEKHRLKHTRRKGYFNYILDLNEKNAQLMKMAFPNLPVSNCTMDVYISYSQVLILEVLRFRDGQLLLRLA